MTDAALLDPNSTPNGLNFGVKRLNYVPILIVVAIFMVFAVVIAVVAMQKADQQQQDNNQVVPVSTNAPRAQNANPVQSILDDAGISHPDASTPYSQTIVSAAEDELPTATDTTIPSVPSQEWEQQGYVEPTDYAANQGYSPAALPPKPYSPDNYEASSLDMSPDAEAIRQIQQARSQLLLQAISAKSRVSFEAGTGSPGSASTYSVVPSGSSDPLSQLQAVQQQLQGAASMLTGAAGNPMSQYQEQLQAVQQMVGAGGGASPMQQALQPVQSGGDGYSQFDGDQSRWNLGSKMQTHQKFTVLAGDFIPGIFVTGINSDLPGQIVGQVSQNVYDSATGKHLLVPQGSKLVGEYASDVVYGQERVLFGWKRINFPDGRTMDIGSMQGADPAGYAGVKDLVNHHFWRIFGSATMMSFVTAGVEITQDDGATLEGGRKAGDALSEALGQQLGQAAAQMIMKNLNIAPTIEIRPGNRFNVVVTKDIVFDKPYVDFDY